MSWRNARTKIRIGWMLASCLTIAVAVFQYHAVRRLVQSSALVAHTHEVQAGLAQLLLLVQEVESTQRGYLITHDASMLERYDDARGRVAPRLKILGELLRDTPAQHKRLAQLDALLIERIRLAHHVLELDSVAAQNEIITGRGRMLMDAVRRAAAEISEQEQVFLTDRMAAARESANFVAVAVPAGFTIVVLVLAVGFNISRKLNRKLQGDVRDRTAELEASLVSLQGSQRDLLRARDELEQRVQERTLELQRSNHDLEQFAYVASHDLQEPLRAISGCVQIIERRYAPQLDAKAHELMKHTVEGVLRMKELIEGLLAYSRVTRTQHEVAAVDASCAVDAAIRHLESGVRETDAQIVYRDLPSVMANQAQLTQLFQNLVGNALKYRSDQRPRIEISAQRDGAAMWQFSIRDNGIGIEPQYFERVFSIFQRLHTRDEYPGSGIGLAICKKIVERAGGRMWIESQLGRGSTFHFTLPQVEA